MEEMKETQFSPEEHKKALIEYLQSCVYRQDWHGVSDAANDLRVLEARYSQLIR